MAPGMVAPEILPTLCSSGQPPVPSTNFNALLIKYTFLQHGTLGINTSRCLDFRYGEGVAPQALGRCYCELFGGAPDKKAVSVDMSKKCFKLCPFWPVTVAAGPHGYRTARYVSCPLAPQLFCQARLRGGHNTLTSPASIDKRQFIGECNRQKTI